ncbi:MAG: hypothetical protein JWQ35_2286 [Bacteriovoracaceae bacterium]|nr:hypothetical protein [Bacteriovoracaceae bacterium]
MASLVEKSEAVSAPDWMGDALKAFRKSPLVQAEAKRLEKLGFQAGEETGAVDPENRPTVTLFKFDYSDKNARYRTYLITKAFFTYGAGEETQTRWVSALVTGRMDGFDVKLFDFEKFKSKIDDFVSKRELLKR